MEEGRSPKAQGLECWRHDQEPRTRRHGDSGERKARGPAAHRNSRPSRGGPCPRHLCPWRLQVGRRMKLFPQGSSGQKESQKTGWRWWGFRSLQTVKLVINHKIIFKDFLSTKKKKIEGRCYLKTPPVLLLGGGRWECNPTEKSLCICILFGVVVTQVYTCVKIHRT